MEKRRLGAASHRETDGMRLGYDESGLGSARCAKMQAQVSWDYWRIDLHALCMDNLGFSSTPEQSWGLQAIRQTRAGENRSARGFGAAGNAEKGVVRQRIVGRRLYGRRWCECGRA